MPWTHFARSLRRSSRIKPSRHLSLCLSLVGSPPLVGCASAAPPAPVAVVTAPPEAQPADAVPRSALPDGKADASQLNFEVRDASKRYDFRISFNAAAGSLKDCTRPEALCSRAGSIDVIPKGAVSVLQSLDQREIWLQLDDAGKPLVNAAGMYDYQGTINVGDFNFDGEEDFAVQVNQEGPYGGPTFAVYLFSGVDKQFRAAPELSQLTREYLGFFTVDAAKQRLIAHSKSGCCYHVRQEFEIDADHAVLVERVIEDGTSGTHLLITEEQLIGRKWQRKTRTAPLPN